MPSVREKERQTFPHKQFMRFSLFQITSLTPGSFVICIYSKRQILGGGVCVCVCYFFATRNVSEKKPNKLSLSTVSDAESARLTGSTLIFLNSLWLRLQIWGVKAGECFCAYCEQTSVSKIHGCVFHFEQLITIHRSCWSSSICLRIAGNLLCFE